jgi:hypothetical protein
VVLLPQVHKQGRKLVQRQTNKGERMSKDENPNLVVFATLKGHNRLSCPVLSQNPIDNQTQVEFNGNGNDNDDDYEEYGNIGIADMVS